MLCKVKSVWLMPSKPVLVGDIVWVAAIRKTTLGSYAVKVFSTYQSSVNMLSPYREIDENIPMHFLEILD